MAKTRYSGVKRKLSLFTVAVIAAFFLCFTIGLFAAQPLYAFADEADLSNLAFDIDTDTYASGATYNASNNTFPVFTLQYTAADAPKNLLTFWYAVSDYADGINKPAADSDAWVELPASDYKPASGEMKVYLSNIARMGYDDSGNFHKYMYFRGGYADESLLYVNNRVIEVNIIGILDASYSIDSVTATYIKDGTQTNYDLTSAEQIWSASPVTIKVTNDGGRARNARFYYQLGENSDPVPFTEKENEYGSPKYYGEVQIPGEDSELKSYSGELILFSTDLSGTKQYAYEQTLYLHFDTAVPEFGVVATVPKGSLVEDYPDNTWTDRAVTYTIDPTQVASGVTYYYSHESGSNNWMPLSGYSYRVDTLGQTDIIFRAVSGSGVVKTSQTYTTKIDNVAPKTSIAAHDRLNAVIRSEGEAEGQGYRVGYASDSVQFTITNAKTQQAGNNVTYYYSTDGVDFEELTATNNNYVVTLTNTAEKRVLHSTYYFRITAASGLSDTASFTVTVLDSSFYTDMSISETHPNGEGWLREAVKVKFTMPKILGVADEYEIRSYLTGNSGLEAAVPFTEVAAPAGYVSYEVTVNTVLDNQSVSFNVYDKARNKVSSLMGADKQPVTNERGEIIPLIAGPYKLDTTVPSAEIVATINGGGNIVLGPGDWSSGEVLITITPEQLASGVKCYPMRGDNPELIPMTMLNGVFTKEVSVSGTYTFRLISGAGVSKDISVVVNIDTGDLVGEGILAYTEDEDGNQIDIIDSDVNLSDGSLLIANNVRLVFKTNHAGHVDIYYAVFTGEFPDLDESDYTLFVPAAGENPDTFLLKMPEEGNSVGALKYSFILKSKAKNSLGDVKQLLPQAVYIKYDVRDFAISVDTTTPISPEWVGAPIEFNLKTVVSEGETPIDVMKYQYRLGNGPWIDIEDMTADGATFIFSGIKNYVGDFEREEQEANPDNSYMSYNGYISFRALNRAGKSSRLNKEQLVKVDVSTPDPRYAISRSAGEIVYDESSARYILYSNATVRYTVPQATGVFAQKAPITYYFRRPAQGDAEDIDTHEGDWSTPRDGSMEFVPNATYWLYAQNSVGKRSRLYKVYIQLESAANAPTAVIVSGGTAGANSNVLEFNWTSQAVIQLRVTSTTAVYFWYSFDGGTTWTRISDIPTKVTGGPIGSVDKSIIFSHAEGPDEFTIPGNRLNTVNFKITNLSGSEYILDKSVIVRIDQAEPLFDVTYSTPSLGTITDLERWYSEAIIAKITPVASDGEVQNPGGVVYTYSLAENGPYEKLRTNLFSTDDLIGFDGNGEVTVWIRAMANATLRISKKSVTFRVDKVAPDFELIGQATKDNVTAGKISSGTWTNADEITISRQTKVVNKSGVRYTYHLSTNDSQETVWADNSTISIQKIAVLHVTAESGAGLVVKKEFEVKIDNDPPIIHAGNIVNNVDHPNEPYRYYIDQVITYVEDNLKSATYNNFPLSNGQIIATNTVDNSNGGYVHIVVEDMAGNKAELTFYMTIFELTVNNIELSDEHRNALDNLTADYENAKADLTSSRQQYFETLIGRLNDRLSMLEKQVEAYQGFLSRINSQASFELQSDYEEMYKYINYFITDDDLIRYPEWQQNKIKEGIYASYYSRLEAEFYKLEAQMATVRSVQNAVIALPATNVVTKGDYQAVVRVYNMYENLSRDQKTVFKPNLYNKIVELKRICEVYLLQDDDSGISIYGDKLVGETTGVMLEVVNYSSDTEYFAQAQTTLYNMYDANTPRKVLSINKLGLGGFGSQYDTGDIVVTLPIPADYRNYVYFAVYRLSADGTVTPINGVMRSPDGGSVYFDTNKLETYILATSANVDKRDDPEKIYGSIAGIEIDGTLLTYITYVVIGMFAVFVVIILLVALRQRRFLRHYNRDHKKALQRRGITRIPKGNAPPPSNPARPEERVSHEHNVYYKK